MLYWQESDVAANHIPADCKQLSLLSSYMRLRWFGSYSSLIITSVCVLTGSQQLQFLSPNSLFLPKCNLQWSLLSCTSAYERKCFVLRVKRLSVVLNITPFCVMQQLQESSVDQQKSSRYDGWYYILEICPWLKVWGSRTVYSQLSLISLISLDLINCICWHQLLHIFASPVFFHLCAVSHSLFSFSHLPL